MKHKRFALQFWFFYVLKLDNIQKQLILKYNKSIFDTRFSKQIIQKNHALFFDIYFQIYIKKYFTKIDLSIKISVLWSFPEVVYTIINLTHIIRIISYYVYKT